MFRFFLDYLLNKHKSNSKNKKVNFKLFEFIIVIFLWGLNRQNPHLFPILCLFAGLYRNYIKY